MEIPHPTPPLRLLLADDDPQVLAALRRRISSLREDWIIISCHTIDAAIRSIRSDPPDALITDLRMTGESGTSLLEHIRALCPMCFRVVLSACTENDLVMGTLDLCHRFFPKPCDAAALVTEVENGVEELRQTMPRDLRVWMSLSKSLPGVPRLYKHISAMVNNPASHIGVIADTIEQEPAITSRLLRVANSAFFGCRHDVSTVEGALQVIGMEIVSMVILGCELFASKENNDWHDNLWNHSMQTAVIAREIARRIDADPDMSFGAALLHDVGKIVLCDILGQATWERGLAESHSQGVLSWIAEDSAFGTSHPAVGGLQFSLWGFPEKIVQSVTWHHQPSRCPARAGRCAAAVHLADALAHHWTDAADSNSCAMDTLWLDACGIPSDPNSYSSLKHLSGKHPHV